MDSTGSGVLIDGTSTLEVFSLLHDLLLDLDLERADVMLVSFGNGP